MNGRCYKDALDRAEDICELCGEQFCATCLLFPRGQRKPPTCKDCALANSGLRGASGPSQPISRREYKKRKKALLGQLEGVEEAEPTLEYFDLADPSSFDKSTELDRRAPKTEEPETVDVVDRFDRSTSPVAPNDDTTGAPLPPPPGPSTPATPPPPTPNLAGAADALAGFAPVDTSVNPLAVESAPPAGTSALPTPEPLPEASASASAADLLARLKADQPIQSQFTPTSRPLDVDPFAAATPPPAAVVPPTQSAAPTSAAAPLSPTSDPFSSSTTPPPPTGGPLGSKTSGPTPSRPKTEPWTPPTIPPRGSNLGAMTGSPPPGSTTATPDALLPPTASPPESREPEDRRPTKGADTDTSGQWIPPSLRGIASPEERAADPLPKRR